jgi:micrococcal nuclease
MKTFYCSLLLLLVALSVHARTIQGKVTRVIDGNTLEFLSAEGEKYTILLWGIDCPELTQSFGNEARLCLEKLSLNKSAAVTIKGKDSAGNSMAEVLIDGKKDPRIQLLKEGLAWTDESKAESELESYRLASQSKKKGLWKDENPTPPWTHRRMVPKHS